MRSTLRTQSYPGSHLNMTPAKTATEPPTEGPQASTRHAADRRPSYSRKSARAIALHERSTERRLAQLEGKQTASPPKCPVASELDADLNAIGDLFNKLEETIGSPETGLQAQLEALEEKILPYEVYRQEAAEAVKQLGDVRDRLREDGLANRKVDTESTRLLHEHEACLREQSARLLDLEHAAEAAKIQDSSLTGLAKVMIRRLRHGDIMAPAVQTELLSMITLPSNVVAGSADTGAMVAASERMFNTPTTDGDSTNSKTNEVEESREDEASPRKRRRLKHRPHSAKKTASRRSSESIASPHSEHARAAPPSGGPAVATSSDAAAITAAEVNLKNVLISPEVRRTGRTPRRTEIAKDMIPWKEAIAQMRATRKAR
ncbi:hypothetical protein B0A50_01837 [Salinomyces thailandicus]|uniref:Uncharacterized protein n=1 Tax=Salinomyces thailandicus TaxID=706561 RepID=A0A4V5N7Y6_9PEZI|nr:hypothetical protein B0A50_01837 [Salinomyces thailandica]